MKNVLLKNVLEEDWVLLKTEAAMHSMNLAEFLAYLLREHSKQHVYTEWNSILSWRSSRSKEKICEHEKKITNIRKTFRMER